MTSAKKQQNGRIRRCSFPELSFTSRRLAPTRSTTTTPSTTTPLRRPPIMFLRRAVPALTKRAVIRPTVTRSFALSARQSTDLSQMGLFPEKCRPPKTRARAHVADRDRRKRT